MAAVFGFGSRTTQVGEMSLEWVDIEWAFIRRSCSRRFRSAKRATKFSIFGLVLNLNVGTTVPSVEHLLGVHRDANKQRMYPLHVVVWDMRTDELPLSLYCRLDDQCTRTYQAGKHTCSRLLSSGPPPLSQHPFSPRPPPLPMLTDRRRTRRNVRKDDGVPGPRTTTREVPSSTTPANLLPLRIIWRG